MGGAIDAALMQYGNYGLLGATCILLMAALVWAMRGRGKAERELRANDKARIAETREITETLITASRNLATVAVAIEASTRSQVEGNNFRSALAAAMESLERAVEANARHLGDRCTETRAALDRQAASAERLAGDVQRLLGRNP